MKHFRYNLKKRDLCQIGCSGKGDLGHDHVRVPASSGKGQKNQDFLIVPWKFVLGIGGCTDFTYLMGYFFYRQSRT